MPYDDNAIHRTVSGRASQHDEQETTKPPRLQTVWHLHFAGTEVPEPRFIVWSRDDRPCSFTTRIKAVEFADRSAYASPGVRFYVGAVIGSAVAAAVYRDADG